MTITRRLGLSPREREPQCVALNNCPDILELDDGDFAIIGLDITDEATPVLPIGSGCGDGERIVRIPRSVLTAAKSDIPN